MVFNLLSPQTRRLIEEKGFLKPTLAQQMGLPEVLAGNDVLIIAATGTGKTESAMLALFDKIKHNNEKPIALLYITPLRALNRNILDRLVWWANKLELEIGVRHGDTPTSERTAQSEIPPHILVTTPEMIQAMLVGKKMREHLKNIKHVVIDEIHELIQSKRGIQLAVALERLAEIAGNFQRIGLSATIGSPETVAEFIGYKTKIIHAESKKQYDISVETPKPDDSDISISDDLFTQPETMARLRRIHRLILSHSSVLTFTNTRETAEILSSRLRSFDKELKQEVHHGSLSKEKRIDSEKKFKEQKIQSIIATSSLELGIDIGSCDLVIQYLSPRQVTRLIQRVGRAGHKVDETSKGIILTGHEDSFESTAIASEAMRCHLETMRTHEMALDVLATQIIGLAMEYGEISDEKILGIVKRSYPFRLLEKPELANLLNFLESIRLIWINPKESGCVIRKRIKAFTHYFENLSMIPDTVQYRIVSIIENEPVGSLDEDFVAEHGKPGEKFIVSGRAWKVIQTDQEKKKVTVEPAHDIESAIPAWEGELIPVPFEIAQGVGEIRSFIANRLNETELTAKLMEKFKIDLSTADDMVDIIKKQSKTHSVPDNRCWLIENYEDFVIIHACNGSRVNDTIGRYLAAIISAKTGVATNVKIDPYRIILQTKAIAKDVYATLKDASNLKEVLELSVSRSSLFKHRFIHVARRFGILRRGAQLEKLSMNKLISQYEETPVWKETAREIMTDKMDIEKAESILTDVKNGKIKIVAQQGLSYIGELGLKHRFAEMIKPAQPDEEIFKAFKRRLLATRIRLVCMTCANYCITKEVRELEEEPECKNCNSRLIAIVKRTLDIVKIAKKKLKKRPLTPEELEIFRQTHRTADLTIVYGKKAAIALAGHGVGPETAARILSKLHTDEDALLKDILAAEKEFTKTRIYWK